MCEKQPFKPFKYGGKGKPGAQGIYPELLKLGNKQFLQKYKLESDQKIKKCITSLLNYRVEQWYIFYNLLYILILRQSNIETLITQLKQSFQRHCRYGIPTKQFKNNISMVIFYIVKFNMEYKTCVNFPYGKILLVTNVLHLLQEQHIKYIFMGTMSLPETFQYVRRVTGLKIRKAPYVDRPSKTHTIELHFTEGEMVFFKEMYNKYIEEINNVEGIPFENFIKQCVIDYKKKVRQTTNENLKHLFSQKKPDKLLQVFAEVYPDIDVIVQYPYLK